MAHNTIIITPRLAVEHQVEMPLIIKITVNKDREGFWVGLLPVQRFSGI
jgi:hypothetical protein